MVGRMPPTLPLTTCAPPCHSLGAQHAHLLPDRRAILRNRRSPAGQAIEPARCPSASTTTTRSGPTSPLAQHGLHRRSGPALAPAVARAVRGYGRAASPMPWPCDCPTHRHAPRGHRCGHSGRGRGRGTRGHRRRGHPRTMDTRTPRTPRTLDTGRADIARADTGHLTPDAWTLTEDADRATKPRQASGHLGPTTSRRPTGRRTMFLWGGSACGAPQP
jgi:hypothetical protein